MRDVDENELRERLSALVRGVDAAPALERPTIRRARRRRLLTAAATTLAVVALAAGSYSGLRAVLSEPTGQFIAPTPSPTIEEPTPTPPPVDATGVPDETAETARAIYEGVRARDFELLGSLLDPMTFVYNLDDGSDPIPEWRRDPTALDAIPAILALPPSAPRELEDYGTFYLWPYLVDSDMSALTDREREDLASLGFSDRDIDSMVDYGGYLGPRLAIDATGLWRNYITGGD